MTPTACHEFIEQLSSIDTVEGLHDVCSRICEKSGFDHFLYGASLPTSFTNPQLFIISGYPSQWWNRYKDCGYMQIDPVIAHCVQRTVPLNWMSLAAVEQENPAVHRMMSEARDFGLRSGMALPMHGSNGESALLCFAADEDPKRARKRMDTYTPYLYLLAAHIHEAARRTVLNDGVPVSRADLTAREKECLLWAADGKTTWETARILGVSERTIVFHLQKATGKLGVVNRPQAVARAVSLGLITPQIG